MLRGIRNASSNWLGKTIMTIVMGLLIVAFGIWGIVVLCLQDVRDSFK